MLLKPLDLFGDGLLATFGNGASRPAQARALYWLHLWLLSGNAAALAWFLTLRALARSLPEPERAISRLLPPAVITVGFGSLTALVFAMQLGGDLSLAVVLFVDAPTLVVSFGLLALAFVRWHAWWEVALAGFGLAVIILTTQLSYLQPGSGEPSEAVIPLSSFPLLVAVALWLGGWSFAPRGTTAPVAR